MNTLDILIILIGILFCFFGIRFRKYVQIFFSFLCGCGFAYFIMFVLVMSRTVDNIDDMLAVFAVLSVGILMAIFSWKFERWLVTIQAILITLVITIVIIGFAFSDISFGIVFIISLVIAGIMGYVTWMYYRYAFICETAIIGAIMINHVWLFGGTSGIGYGYYEDGNLFAVLLTIITAIAGIVVQSKTLKRMEGRTDGKTHQWRNLPFSFNFVTEVFNRSDVKKLRASSLNRYEKLMVVAPVSAFLVNRILNSMYNTESESMYSILMSTGTFRMYLNVILEGVFVGGIIYFVIYYEFKVSAIYQLLYLTCLPVEIWEQSNYGYSTMLSNGAGAAILSILEYCIPWIIFLILDKCIHNIKIKSIVMCILAICWFPAISVFLELGVFYPSVSLYNCLKWLGIAGGIFVLPYLKKSHYHY